MRFDKKTLYLLHQAIDSISLNFGSEIENPSVRQKVFRALLLLKEEMSANLNMPRGKNRQKKKLIESADHIIHIFKSKSNAN